MSENLPGVPFCRYSDDGVLHCKSKVQAELVIQKLGDRFGECGLELHPDKTQIVYCRDSKRKGNYPVTRFTFLGFTFCSREAVGKAGIYFTGFLPGVSTEALRHMRQTIRGWKLQLKSSLNLADLSVRFNPILRGWKNYYTRFYGSAMVSVWNHMDYYLVRWMMRKYKNLRQHKTKTIGRLELLKQEHPNVFVYWKAGHYTLKVG